MISTLAPALTLPATTRTAAPSSACEGGVATTRRLDAYVPSETRAEATRPGCAPDAGCASKRSPLTRALVGAALGAAYGAAIGSGTAIGYATAGLSNGTLMHMGLIVAGAAAGVPVMGKVLEGKVEKPSNYVLGGLLGAGLTWGTSSMGMLGSPVVGAVGGAVLGAFYGGFAGAIS